MDAAQGGGKVGDATRRGEQLPCPPGHFCKRARKRRCAAGRWSSGTVAGGARATNSSACEGACAPGYWCPSGSVSPRERACPAGRYAAIAGSRSAACEGACAPGHFCAAASVSRTAALCSAADSSVYCPEGTTAQQRAPEGWWTQTLPLSRIAQIAEMESRNASLRSTIERCDVGFWCSAGVRAPCPAGALCRCDVAWTSSSCPSPPHLLCSRHPLRFPFLPHPSATGRYGATLALSSAACSGSATRGYWTAAGSRSATQHACPIGRYGARTGLTKAEECTLCRSGVVCGLAATSESASL